MRRGGTRESEEYLDVGIIQMPNVKVLHTRTRDVYKAQHGTQTDLSLSSLSLDCVCVCVWLSGAEPAPYQINAFDIVAEIIICMFKKGAPPTHRRAAAGQYIYRYVYIYTVR